MHSTALAAALKATHPWLSPRFRLASEGFAIHCVCLADHLSVVGSCHAHRCRIPGFRTTGSWTIQYALVSSQSFYFALDTSLLWNGFCVLCFSLVCHGRAFPMAQRTLEHLITSVNAWYTISSCGAGIVSWLRSLYRCVSRSWLTLHRDAGIVRETSAPSGSRWKSSHQVKLFLAFPRVF
jgi:hypothetical protein